MYYVHILFLGTLQKRLLKTSRPPVSARKLSLTPPAPLQSRRLARLMRRPPSRRPPLPRPRRPSRHWRPQRRPKTRQPRGPLAATRSRKAADFSDAAARRRRETLQSAGRKPLPAASSAASHCPAARARTSRPSGRRLLLTHLVRRRRRRLATAVAQPKEGRLRRCRGPC